MPKMIDSELKARSVSLVSERLGKDPSLKAATDFFAGELRSWHLVIKGLIDIMEAEGHAVRVDESGLARAGLSDRHADLPELETGESHGSPGRTQSDAYVVDAVRDIA